MDPATGASLGIDVKTVSQGLPVGFSVPYRSRHQADRGLCRDGRGGRLDATLRNAAGVPVLTKGNPSPLSVVVTEVSAAAPSATPSRPRSGAATESRRNDDGNR